MMHEALICNPYEVDEAAEVIHRWVDHHHKLVIKSCIDLEKYYKLLKNKLPS